MFLVPPDMTPREVDHRRQAKFLYWMGWQVTDIAEYQGEPRATVASWKSRDNWDKSPVLERVETCTEARYTQLVCKTAKTGADFKEIDLLGRQLEKFARIRRYEAPGGHEGDLNPKVHHRNMQAAQKRPQRNYFDPDQAEKAKEAFLDELFGHQRLWYANADERTRAILKSRQVGATWYFAREALIDAIETGRNQIFLSASKAQAHVFRQYIVAFAKMSCGVDLTGDPIVIDRGEGQEPATLYFLGTNARTAQGYHGNFYFDEFFWTFRFQELNKVASGMATHKRWRKTYFSTPSSVNHEAYPFWTGELFNRRRPKDQRQEIDTTWKALAGGARGPDRIWRNIVTIEDAEAAGCDLFDIAELRDEYNPADFANLFMCDFIDDTLSVFPMAMLAPCMVDAWVDWEDYNAVADRPFGNAPVWIGHDPSLTGDSAAIMVLAPPSTPKGKFRCLEKHQFRGMDFPGQAELIRRLCRKYNVTYVGIDVTGMGQGLLPLVRAFFPNVTAIHYSPEVKSRMVLKAFDVISRGRLEFDAGWTDLAAALMAIRKTMTASGRAVTYEASRSADTGHADLAWALLHTLINEPLEAPHGGGGKAVVEIYG